MTTTKQFDKGEFYTIEAFYFTEEDGIIYGEDRNEEVDTYWHIKLDINLMDYVLEQCQTKLTEPSIVDVLPRKWADFNDKYELEDCGDTCYGIERYIWTGKKLVTEEEYTELVTV
jgi:hypothetical protein